MTRTTLQVARIEDLTILEELKETWDTLLEHNRTKTVELTYEWEITYWKHFHQNAELFVLVIRDAGTVVAIAPLKLTHTTQFGVKARVLEFIAADESNYQDFIIGQDTEAALTSLLNYLTENSELWDLLKLSHIPEASPTAQFLLKTQRNKLPHRIAEITPCTYLKVKGNWEEHAKSLKKKRRRKKMNERMRALRKYGEISVCHCEDITKLDANLQKFFELHRKRWNPTSTPSQFSDSRCCEFYLDITPQLFSKGQVELFILKTGAVPVAILYYFMLDQDCLLQLIAYDPDYSQGSPAIVLLELFTKEAFTREIKTIDQGYYYHYKELWADRIKNRLDIEVYPRKPISRYIHILKSTFSFLKETLKKIKPLRESVRYTRRKVKTFFRKNHQPRPKQNTGHTFQEKIMPR